MRYLKHWPGLVSRNTTRRGACVGSAKLHNTRASFAQIYIYFRFRSTGGSHLLAIVVVKTIVTEPIVRVARKTITSKLAWVLAGAIQE